ncbi:branched-chain amino acid ABC transporter substrate-binding protein [Actinoalloteichus hymeniacidonis]|uniref:ABC-type branched-chain amino acid transport system, periplasmic component n=1 Tax=Actinoalloteichus hymeniacidonis TaxID=340345 RepID=A0AAC9MYC7_9PSEU|nr:branched-chain amino acid ABC transporter substrate-binding protein [Actinoalloteichus hymeniacidonis]AOS62852.1 ABC-type branched-chain amino acid transport system, periplasmic component [Actinoalloteichus hymeniacidonis]MBB5909115.1 branched-chain amino acid transport system substrate-binding protein [Actinoalloteichus hymeniacidonis]
MSQTRLVRTLALAAVLSLTVAGCAQNTEDDSAGPSGDGGASADSPGVPENVVLPAGDGSGECEDVAIAYIGTIAGQNAALGLNILNGVRLAVQEHNDANENCQVELLEYDTEGTPDRAPGVVTEAINNESVLGVVGLPFSGESAAVGDSFASAGLVALSPSATRPDLSTNGWDTFFRALGNDSVQGPAAASFISENLGAESVCIVQDDSAYGMGLAEEVASALGDAVTCNEEIRTQQVEFSAVIGSIEATEPDAIFFAGYYQEAAPFAQQLYDTGLEVDLVAPDGVRDNEFVINAGDAAEGVYFTCPCVPSGGFTDFTSAFEELAGAEPSTYSPEGYDAATILLTALDQGLSTREEVLDYVREYNGQGLTKNFQWDETGELTDTPVWSYRVEGGEIVQGEQIG